MSQARDLTVDIAKGITIILIVLSHAIVGVWHADTIDDEARGALMPALYLVHIVVFAFLSGLFVARGVERSGAARYLASRAALFIWLYLLWTLLQRGARVIGGPFSANQASPLELLTVWRPEGQLWFLPWLLAATVLVVVARPWASAIRGWGLLVATSVMALLVWGWEPNVVVVQGLAITPFFVAGALVRGDRMSELVRRLGVPALTAAVVVAGGLYALVVTVAHFAMPTAASPDRSPVPLAWGVLGSVSGLVLVLAVSALLARSVGTGAVAALGRRSMEIYLGHILVGSLTRAALVEVGVSDGLAHLVVGTVTGVLVPVLVWWAATRLGQGWLFALPKGVERRLTGAPAQASRPAGAEGSAA